MSLNNRKYNEAMTYYDDIAEGYEELHKEEQEKKVRLLKKYIVVKQKEKILDVGCGTGLTTLPWDGQRYGVDPSKKLIERAREKESVIYKVAPAEDIPYPDHFFDWVISITAIQNFEDIEKGLLEMKRVGKERFVVTTLKQSPKIKEIERMVKKHFQVKETIEEEKDRIFLI